jgi:glutaredoxin
MRRRTRVQLHLYTRQGCGLCERAEGFVATEARGADVHVVDVDTEEDLQTRYGVRVPVLLVDGTEVAAYELSPGDVRRAIRAARRGC